MRHVELTELTKLVREEEEYSTLRDQQYTFQMFLKDCESWIRVDHWTKEQWLLSVYVVTLMLASASERIIFKVTVDGMAPFRAVLLLLILLTSIFAFACIAIGKRLIYQDMSLSNIFPDRKLIIMALFDTLSFGGLIISATGVTPTMTIILMHANTPLIVIGSRYIFPERVYSTLQNVGIFLITIALFISISRPLFHLFGFDGSNTTKHHDSQYTSAICALLYLSSAALQGIGALYKEKAIIEFSQPADVHVMSCWLFFYQFLYALIGYPLFYALQGISNDWKGYPISSFVDNFWDGLYCWLGEDPDPLTALYDTERTSCVILFWLIIGYVLSTILVLYCVEKILITNSKILGRTMAIAVLFSFLIAWLYDIYYGDLIQDSTFGSADICAMVVLLVGMEIFGRDPEPDAELMTNYSPSSRI